MSFEEIVAVLEKAFKLELKIVDDTTAFEVAGEGSAFSASVAVKFDAKNPDELAGLALYQNEQCNYVLGVTAGADGKPCVSLAKSDKEGKKAVASAALPKNGAVMLKVEAKNEVVRFFWSLDGKRWSAIGGDEDARILTTDYAGGFVGSAVGLYATTKAE